MQYSLSGVDWYPGLQAHWYFPIRLTQRPFRHRLVLSSHSLMSVAKEKEEHIFVLKMILSKHCKCTAQERYKMLCTILILPACLTYTCRDIWWYLVAWRAIAPEASLCVDAGATSAEKGIALTLVDVCGEKGKHISAGPAYPSPQPLTHHSSVCLISILQPVLEPIIPCTITQLENNSKRFLLNFNLP